MISWHRVLRTLLLGSVVTVLLSEFSQYVSTLQLGLEPGDSTVSPTSESLVAPAASIGHVALSSWPKEKHGTTQERGDVTTNVPFALPLPPSKPPPPPVPPAIPSVSHVVHLPSPPQSHIEVPSTKQTAVETVRETDAHVKRLAEISRAGNVAPIRSSTRVQPENDSENPFTTKSVHDEDGNFPFGNEFVTILEEPGVVALEPQPPQQPKPQRRIPPTPALKSKKNTGKGIRTAVSNTTEVQHNGYLRPSPASSCVAGTVAYFSEVPNNRIQAAALKVKHRPTCAFSLEPSDVVAGVWHCAKCESQLSTVSQTWGSNLTTLYLASSKGIALSASKPQKNRRSSTPLLDTGGSEDDYLSTLRKGLVGLKLMYKTFPSKAWFAILGDDVFVRPQALADLLSAFNPDEDWCFSQSSPHPRHGFRAFGGAGIITSRSLTRKLAPVVEEWANSVRKSGSNNDRLHDVAFVRLLAKTSPKFRLTNLDGLYSQPPGFYLSKEGKADVPRGLPPLSATFHYIKNRYMNHLHVISQQVCVHCRPLLGANLSKHSNSGTLSWALDIGHKFLQKDVPTSRAAEISPEQLALMRRKVHVILAPSKLEQLSKTNKDVWMRNERLYREHVVEQTWGRWLDFTLAGGNDGFSGALASAMAAASSNRRSDSERDWYVLCWSTVYVVPSNLVAALSELDPNEPLLVTGPFALVDGKLDQNSGLRCGMVMSRTLLAALQEKSQKGGSSVVSSGEAAAEATRQAGGRVVLDGAFGLAGAGGAGAHYGGSTAGAEGSVPPGHVAAAATVACGIPAGKDQEVRMAQDAGHGGLRVAHFLLGAVRARQLGLGSLEGRCSAGYSAPLRRDKGKQDTAPARPPPPSECDF